MSPDLDPYRTLGLPADASLSEVRRAYRRLAKANHPDAAGPTSLPRFLAIQRAYDRILASDGRDPVGGDAGGTARPRRPWDADPDRANATRRAYGGRAGRTRGRSARTPGTGSPGTGSPGTPPGSTDGARPTRAPNRATLGSTSYDGAEAEPFEPDWGGASWYGTTSGTYWTLNPKEYADPRKHGPEYQARARRAAAAQAGSADAAQGDPTAVDRDPADTTGAEPTGADPASGNPVHADTTGAPPASANPAPADPVMPDPPRGPSHTTASWWDATAGAPDGGQGGSDPATAAADPTRPRREARSLLDRVLGRRSGPVS